VNAAHVGINLNKSINMIITNLVSPRAKDCFCSEENIDSLLDLVDKVLCREGSAFELASKYDLVDKVSITDMSILLAYRRMFLSKLDSCTGCFSDHNIQEIKSKLLRILYK